MNLISQPAALKSQRDKRLNREVVYGSPTALSAKEADLVDELQLAKPKKRKSWITDDSLGEKGKKAEQEEMKRLEGFLFGTLYSPLEYGKEDNDIDIDTDNDSEHVEQAGLDAPLFFIDKSIDNEMIVYEEDLHASGEDLTEGLKPAWIDEQEEMAKVDIVRINRLRKLRKEADEHVISGADFVARLHALHSKLNPGVEWASIDWKCTHQGGFDGVIDDESCVTVACGFEDAEGSSDILRSTDELVVKDTTKLMPGLLEYSRLVDANAVEPSSGPINSVQFHRNGQLLLTAGYDRRLRFFQVDGKRNPKIQSIFVEDCPIHKAAFLSDGSEVILAGRRKFFYSFDLVKAVVSKIGPLTGRDERSLENFEVSPDSNTIAFIGNEGYILLVSSRTKELIGTLKMNGSVQALAFTAGGQQLLSSGGDGHVYHWDLRTRKCLHKGIDEGSIAGSALCASPDSSLFAAGSSSGIVNIHGREDFLGGKRKPLKTIENLTTMVDQMMFNHDAQILAISSRMKKDGVKLVHIPSFSVFSNFPPRLSLQYPRCLDFSPGGGLLTVGNAGGKVLLYKLHHYQNA